MNTLIAGSGGIVWMTIVVLMLGVVTGFAFWGNNPSSKLLADTLSEPLDGAQTAIVDINVGDGNLAIDRITGGEQLLASGTLQYAEKSGPPTRIVDASNGQVKFTLHDADAERPWFRLPWAACNGASEWQIHLNPTVPLDITAHSNGGNVKLDLAGMLITRVMADTGGGNMEIALPDHAENLNVAAKSGAGNVVVHVPSGVAALIHARTGLGKVIMDPRFDKIDGNTYQSPDYASAANTVEITLSSGAGNVSVSTE